MPMRRCMQREGPVGGRLTFYPLPARLKRSCLNLAARAKRVCRCVCDKTAPRWLGREPASPSGPGVRQRARRLGRLSRSVYRATIRRQRHVFKTSWRARSAVEFLGNGGSRWKRGVYHPNVNLHSFRPTRLEASARQVASLAAIRFGGSKRGRLHCMPAGRATLAVMTAERIALLTLSAIALVALIMWPVIGAFFIARRSPQRCPFCDRNQIRPSMRGFWDRFVFWAHPLRCTACNRRFYASRRVVDEWRSNKAAQDR